MHGGVTPYSPTGHRHIAEIEQPRAAGGGVASPSRRTSLPTSRGLLVTCYVRLAGRSARPTSTRSTPSATPASRSSALGETRRAAARCTARTAATSASWPTSRTGTAIVAAALDNLVKGAAGQAIQNANLMLGLDEGAGLTAHGRLWP